ncbi:putative DNA mismatch repair protein (Mlh3) [Aspergillus clavatus NRRL 1]|uniref:DNA mismatch repair protein (Mlh3), putative n=1 Tax=Aspergillus clavatus (strain ATCC 1007 / CBS 513.65 / DSM 816 / NCTC 3887 / NRRL 1 / QM 1276 / 107) TaxID=344612 RepID=A1CGV6_ASPCL|nr:DNA mismatch repair protein (Mlh3), putative [Aspergillus clavatus NRRL 1]EAW10111.1 DNA mismatch repair protein (Mlh3), putative [Aspergillus clavatus NRRL 1]
MPLDDHKIRPLPPDAVAKIKSSTSITHLNGVIVELVKNALDANARTVFVTVDIQRGGCMVEDDGDGIPPSEFGSQGGLGKAHHTSKLHLQNAVHGQSGSFLASLASLSLLTVTSHHFREDSTNSIIFHHSTPIARLTPAPATHHLRFSGHGTCVTVNDLFGNMPVRVKSRALALQKLDELERQWDDLRQLLIALMLANDGLTKLVVLTTGEERRLMIRSQLGNQGATGEVDMLRITSILTQAGLLEAQNAGRWESVSACVSGISVYAAISPVPSPTKKVQFISFGIHSVFPRQNTNLLYTEINRLFALSDFGGTAPFSSHGNASPRSMGKTANKWPMFYIRIVVDRPREFCNSSHETVPESNNSIQRVMDVVTAMVIEFLRQHGLRPRAKARKRNTSQRLASNQSSVASERSLEQPVRPYGRPSGTEDAFGGQLKLPSFKRPASGGIGADFANWSRVKSAKEPFNTYDTPVGLKNARAGLLEDGNGSQVPSSPKMDGCLASKRTETGEESESGVDMVIPWVDPYTGRTHWVDSRTGQSVNRKSSMTATLDKERPRLTGTFHGLRMSDQSRPASSEGRNHWVENLLDGWTNPAYSRPEQPINTIDDGRRFGHLSNTTTMRPDDTSGEYCRLEDLGLGKFRGKIHEQDLATAEIIAQVDRNFILARIGDAQRSRSSLILVDQHAADERCRVEHLFGGLFADNDNSLCPIHTIRIDPITFEIPLTEASLFGQYAGVLASWGVGYTVTQGPGGRATVHVGFLPTLIAERCRVENSLVIDLIRSEIWQREDERHGPLTVEMRSREEAARDIEPRWVDRLQACPRGIIDLLNSRACRTAIMFNDVLTVDECQSLVSRLRQCVLPFQCAHGRPSMVPILDLREADGSAMLGGRDECEYEMTEGCGPRSFVEAFQSWQSRG